MKLKKVLIGVLCITMSWMNPLSVSAGSLDTETKLVDVCEEDDENIVLSPISLTQAFGMVGNGATGETKKEIEGLLGMSVSKYNKFSKDYISNLSGIVKVANTVLLTSDKRYKLNKSYTKNLKTYYNTSCKRVTFGTEESVKTINNWASKNTGGMIKELVKETDSDTRLMLMNAVYFNGKWASPFSANDTFTGDFTNSQGKIDKVDFMCGGESSYLENKKAYGVVKSYKGNRYKFIAVLPKSKGNFKLSSLNINKLMKLEKSKKVSYTLPKFNIETDLNLNNVLQDDFGMKTAFNAVTAKFPKLLSSGQNLHIDTVKQKAVIKVDELGTKAAAVTSIIMTDNAVMIDDSKHIDFNRPFAYLIYDSKMKVVLFAGKVNHF